MHNTHCIIIVQTPGGHHNFHSAFTIIINEALHAYFTCCRSSSLHLFEDSCLCRSLTVLAGSQYMYGSAFIARVGPVIS